MKASVKPREVRRKPIDGKETFPDLLNNLYTEMQEPTESPNDDKDDEDGEKWVPGIINNLKKS